MNTITRRALVACALAAGVSIGVAGCQRSGPGGGTTTSRGQGSSAAASGKSVPNDARRVAEGSGTKLIHRALRPGTIWVQDATAGAVVYTGQVRADSNVVVDPEADVVAINDMEVRHSPKLNPDHRYRLYFRQ